ncbi:MAG TPA: tetratricopeptide repeat protein, partial [Longimicrobium sp.]|nr:tetratricopeptide repeat protein [Longimicrobium sp.]
MKSTLLPHIPRPREEDRLRTFLLERLEPRAGVPKALLLGGPPGVGKRTLLRRVFNGDPRLRPYQLADAATREIMAGSAPRGAWKGQVVDAAGAGLGAVNPAIGVGIAVVSPYVKDRLSGRTEPDTARDPFLEKTGKPLLTVVPGVDAEDGDALAFHAHRIREAHDRALPHALVILDDSPLLPPADATTAGDGTRPGSSRGLAGLRRFLGDDRRLEVLKLSPFSEAECREALVRLGLSADWAAALYQLSDGGPAELCALWASLQAAGTIVPADGGRWKAVESGTAGAGWTLVRDALSALLQPRIPGDTIHRNRLLDACQLAASMGSAFLPQAVAECVFEVDPKRDDLDRAEWEDLWYDVLEHESPEHPALAPPCISEDRPEMVQGDGRQFFVHAFRDPGLRNLLRAATRQMWRDWRAHQGANRPHELLVAASREMEGWIGRSFQVGWPLALPFRAALLRVSDRDWEASDLEDLDYRLRLRDKLRVQVEEERRRVARGEQAGHLYACLLWYAETLEKLGEYARETDALSEAMGLADRGSIAVSPKESIDLRTRLGASLVKQALYPRAEKLISETVSLSVSHLGVDHPYTLTLAEHLAILYRKQGRYDEAEPLYLRALKGRERVLGPEHPDTLIAANNLAGLYTVQGRYDEAEPLYLL